ncbi:MAG: chemotaxis protein CheX [Lachnospiraceae bacterium]|nr:chemotaxis protein CheX [Lachnospiraceae bacterium]
MVANIVGAYLVEQNILTQEQLKDALYEMQKTRAKLGLIAVADGILSAEDADLINRKQALQDKRFGDIAVEMGLLDEMQVRKLLEKQGDGYMSFAQVLENMGLMNIEQLEQCLVDFRQENHFTNADIESLKTDDPDKILPLYMPHGSEPYFEICGMCLRTLIRFVDRQIYPGRGFYAETLRSDHAALQLAEGAPSMSAGISGTKDSLLPLASIFGKEDFKEMDDYALDAVAEFVNCVNGLYVSEKSREGMKFELMPPEFSTGIEALSSERMLVLPVYIKNRPVDFVVALNKTITLE